MVPAATNRRQLPPHGAVGPQGHALEERRASRARVAPDELRGEREEQLVEQPCAREPGQDVGTALAEQDAGAQASGEVDQRRRGHTIAIADRLDADAVPEPQAPQAPGRGSEVPR